MIKLSGKEIVLGPTNHASIQTNLHARKIDLNFTLETFVMKFLGPEML